MTRTWDVTCLNRHLSRVPNHHTCAKSHWKVVHCFVRVGNFFSKLNHVFSNVAYNQPRDPELACILIEVVQSRVRLRFFLVRCGQTPFLAVQDQVQFIAVVSRTYARKRIGGFHALVGSRFTHSFFPLRLSSIAVHRHTAFFVGTDMSTYFPRKKVLQFDTEFPSSLDSW